MKRIKITYLFSALAASILVVGGISAGHDRANKGILLDTTGGIADGKRCVYSQGNPSLLGSGEEPARSGVVCEGTRFEAFELEESATGTPPHLVYSNYIGSYIKEGSSDKPGAKRRVVFTDGEPQKIQKLKKG